MMETEQLVRATVFATTMRLVSDALTSIQSGTTLDAALETYREHWNGSHCPILVGYIENFDWPSEEVRDYGERLIRDAVDVNKHLLFQLAWIVNRGTATEL